MYIPDVIGQSRLYNFHTHTQFCDGHATMEEFATAAVNAGFTHYGFSPHSPIVIPSPCNMPKEDVPTFFNEVKRLQAKYIGKIKFYAAMEIDYLNSDWNPSIDYFQDLPLDYRIGSVHFIPSQTGEFIDIDGRFDSFKCKMSEKFHNDIRYVVETFYAQSVKMLETGGFDIIGHFDKVGHNSSLYCPGIEDEKWYRNLIDNLIDIIIEKKIIVELNTKSWREHHRMFPNIRYLPRLVKSKVPIIVNSDAHYPKFINDSRNDAFNILDQISSLQ